MAAVAEEAEKVEKAVEEKAGGGSAPSTVSLLADFPRVQEMYAVPVGMMVGSYGGGAAMQMSRQLAMVQLDAAGTVSAAFRQQIVEDAQRALKAHQQVAADKRVAKLPAELDAGKLRWSAALQVSSHVYAFDDFGMPSTTFNVFCHGRLFREVVREKGRLGCQKYPLLGMYGASEGITFPAQGQVAGIGRDALKWADQHVHLVDGAWHFGSDMAKFGVTGSGKAPVATATVVCLDTELMEADVTVLVLVAMSHEDAAERALRKCATEKPEGHVRVAALRKELSTLTGGAAVLQSMAF